ncbi:MAG: beta-ketoacyl-ACP synthase II [Actinomycetota bacterium]
MTLLRPDGRRRVVVTGLGLITPLGTGPEEVWASAVAGRSGAGPITLFDASEHDTSFACEVKGFDPLAYMDRKSARRMDRFAQLGVAAARLALENAGVAPDGEADRIGVLVGSGVGGLGTFQEQAAIYAERGPSRVSPLFIPMMIANMASAQISMELGLKGPLSCATTACASGNHAIGDATELIRRGSADVMITGGAEAAVTGIGIAAFNAMKALSTRNDDPAGGSRPFDAGRDGFVMGEAGAIIVLEELGRALDRGADILCEVVGYGLSGDAHHLTEPDPTGEGPARAVTMALQDAGASPDEVDYVNAHGTSTPVGDPAEVRVLKIALGEDVAARTPVSSTKSMHGHCLGAAGGLEGALVSLAIARGVIPPTINLADLDPDCGDVDHVANAAREADVRLALSNSFGFGGHNATLAFARLEDR